MAQARASERHKGKVQARVGGRWHRQDDVARVQQGQPHAPSRTCALSLCSHAMCSHPTFTLILALAIPYHKYSGTRYLNLWVFRHSRHGPQFTPIKVNYMSQYDLLCYYQSILLHTFYTIAHMLRCAYIMLIP